MIQTLVVDDSLTSREQLIGILESDQKIQARSAKDGLEALQKVKEQKPDIIVMDVNMPGMDGYETTKRILEISPIPIIICSSMLKSSENTLALKATEAGAVAALPKPPGIGDPLFRSKAMEFIRTVKAMSEVRVIQRVAKYSKNHLKTPQASSSDGNTVACPTTCKTPTAFLRLKTEAIVIGASTGGPPILKMILSELDRNFSVPILIVQHIASGFLEDMVRWLRTELHRDVVVASHLQRVDPGKIYFAPDHVHMGVKHQKIILDEESAHEYGLKPAVSYLFRSATGQYGNQAIGILLTGMGIDGAKELKELRNRGAPTIVQNKESCVVFGMPGEAVKLNAADYILPPEEIAPTLNDIISKQAR